MIDLLVIGSPIVIGIVLSLVTLIPAVNKWVKKSRLAKTTSLLILGFIATALASIAVASVFAAISTVFALEDLPFSKQELYSEAVFKELWIRLWIPPLLQHGCYSTQDFVCAYARIHDPNGSYLLVVGFSSIAGITSLVLAYIFTLKIPSSQTDLPT